MPWTLILPEAATTSASTVVEMTLPKKARNPCCDAANASSLAEDIRRIVPAMAKVVDRYKVPRKKKKSQSPEMRIKAPKGKKKTRARAETGPSPFKE